MNLPAAIGRPIIGILLFALATTTAAEARGPKPVSFLAADGHRLAADYHPPPTGRSDPAPFVILLHAHRSDRAAWESLIEPLHQAGFAILALDLRGHGQSATTETRERVAQRDPAVFRDMQADLRGAYDWLAAQPDLDRARFALVGASVGASLALQYAAQDRSVDAVVCLSPGLNYMGIDSAGDIHQITGRALLLLACEHERDAPYTLSDRGRGVQVQVYPGSAHGTDMFTAVPKLTDRITRFLVDGVGRPSQDIVVGSIEKNIYHFPQSGWAQRVSPTNLRYYSSPREAEARGLRASRSSGPRK